MARTRHGRRARAAVHGEGGHRMSRLLLYLPVLACPLLMVACMIAMRRMGGSTGQPQRSATDTAAHIAALEQELAAVRAQQAATQAADAGAAAREADRSSTPADRVS
jgi:hypothetical protein